MLKYLLVFSSIFLSLGLFAQQVLTPRVAVYNTDEERYIVDSAELKDSVLVMQIGELSFEIPEHRLARIEPIPGASFSRPDQIYSFSMKSGEVIVGQVKSYRGGVITIRTSDDDIEVIVSDELQGLNQEKRSIFEKPFVKKTAATNFISSPYALNTGEIVFTSNIYANTLEVGLGNGFSAKLLSSVVPIVLPTGYELSYRRKLPNSNFSIGMSLGQVWMGLVGEVSVDEVVNSRRNFINIVSPNFTYHMGDSYLKTGVTVLSGSSSLTKEGAYLITSTYSMPGVKRPWNRWNFTANVLANDASSAIGIRTLLLAGYQSHAPKASSTIGVGLMQVDDFGIFPFPYASFALYTSKEQRTVAKAFDLHRRMKVVKRTVAFKNTRERRLREREEQRQERMIKRKDRLSRK